MAVGIGDLETPQAFVYERQLYHERRTQRSVATPPPATTDWAATVGLEDHRQLHQAAHDEAGAPRQGFRRHLQPEAGQAAQQRA